LDVSDEGKALKCWPYLGEKSADQTGKPPIGGTKDTEVGHRSARRLYQQRPAGCARRWPETCQLRGDATGDHQKLQTDNVFHVKNGEGEIQLGEQVTLSGRITRDPGNRRKERERDFVFVLETTNGLEEKERAVKAKGCLEDRDRKGGGYAPEKENGEKGKESGEGTPLRREDAWRFEGQRQEQQ